MRFIKRPVSCDLLWGESISLLTSLLIRRALILRDMTPKWTTSLLYAVILSFTLFFGFSYNNLFASPNLFQSYELKNTDADTGSESGISISLHPEKHISRAANTIKLRWNVTQGYRSPDGVRKLVFLINGTGLSIIVYNLLLKQPRRVPRSYH